MKRLNEVWNGKNTQPLPNTQVLETGITNLESSQVRKSIESWLVLNLAQRLELQTDDIDIHKDFIDYGLNSIEAVNLSGELENFIGRRLPPTLLWDYPNVLALAKYLVAENPAEIFKVAQSMSIYENGRNSDSIRAKNNGHSTVENREEKSEKNEIIPEYYRFDQFPKYRQLQKQLGEIRELGIHNPFFLTQEKINDNTYFNCRQRTA